MKFCALAFTVFAQLVESTQFFDVLRSGELHHCAVLQYIILAAQFHLFNNQFRRSAAK